MDCAQLYHTYFTRELRWLQKRVRNGRDAEDILASAFVKVVQYCEANPAYEVRHPSIWLRTIVYHSLIDYWRYWAARPAYCSGPEHQAFVDWLDDMQAMIDDDFADRIIDQMEANDYIHGLLENERIPDRERHLLALRLHEYEYGEIAEELQLVSAAAARGIFFRARSNHFQELFCTSAAGAEAPTLYFADLLP